MRQTVKFVYITLFFWVQGGMGGWDLDVQSPLEDRPPHSTLRNTQGGLLPSDNKFIL